MSKDLFEIADSVETEIDFLNFLEALMQDRQDEEQKEKANLSSPYGPGANGWENGSISTFLDAAIAWGQASENEKRGQVFDLYPPFSQITEHTAAQY